MTNKENLQQLLQRSVKLFGEDAPLTLNLKRKLRQIEEQSSAATTASEFLQFHAGFRKGKKSKKSAAQ
jgi:hypothetical protein